MLKYVKILPHSTGLFLLNMHKDNIKFQKLETQLRRLMAKASGDFGLLEAGDRIMVCLSGGKDSYAMLSLLQLIQQKAPFEFDMVAVNLDQKQPGFPEHILPAYLDELGIEYKIIEEDTYSIVKEIIPEGKTTCGLCSRLRRGILYRVADELNCNKIALGHHQDDMVETLFLNLFFGAKLKAMPPKLLSDDGQHLVIRPMAYIREHDLISYAEYKDYPIIPCNLCGSQENLQRQAIKHMLHQWDQINPGRVNNIANAMCNVVPSHLCDTELFDFKGLAQIDLPKLLKL